MSEWKKGKNNRGIWVEGELIAIDGIYCIAGNPIDWKTICRKTDFTDKAGKVIWEHDVMDTRETVEWDRVAGKWYLRADATGFLRMLDENVVWQCTVMRNKMDERQEFEPNSVWEWWKDSRVYEGRFHGPDGKSFSVEGVTAEMVGLYCEAYGIEEVNPELEKYVRWGSEEYFVELRDNKVCVVDRDYDIVIWSGNKLAEIETRLEKIGLVADWTW